MNPLEKMIPRLKLVSLIAMIGILNAYGQQQPASIAYSKEEVSVSTPFAAGVISTKENSEFELTFSVDGRKVYFSRRAPEGKQMIFETTFENGQWTPPTRADFSTDRDETPYITPNGKYLFFGSERPIPDQPNLGNFDMNVWVMERTATGWSDPKPLPAPINAVQRAQEEWPSSNNNFLFTNDNKEFYFTTMRRGTTGIKLYRSTFDGETFSEPIAIEGLFEDEKAWVYSAIISPDGNYLVFNSYEAPGGEGGEDIFVAQKVRNGWSRARSIGKLVNTQNEESSPRFSRDGKYFFFSRAEKLGNSEYGEWSIFFIETKFLQLAAQFK